MQRLTRFLQRITFLMNVEVDHPIAIIETPTDEGCSPGRKAELAEADLDTPAADPLRLGSKVPQPGADKFQDLLSRRTGRGVLQNLQTDLLLSQPGADIHSPTL